MKSFLQLTIIAILFPLFGWVADLSEADAANC